MVIIPEEALEIISYIDNYMCYHPTFTSKGGPLVKQYEKFGVVYHARNREGMPANGTVIFFDYHTKKFDVASRKCKCYGVVAYERTKEVAEYKDVLKTIHDILYSEDYFRIIER